MTGTELCEYKKARYRDLSVFQMKLAESACLREIMDADWVKRIHEVIDSIAPDYSFTDNAFQLFRLLHDEGLLQRLDESIAILAPIASKQNKLRPFRETEAKLKSKEANQIEAAVFEFIVLGSFAMLCAAEYFEILLYPTVGTGNSNIEAKIQIDSRWCNVEAKLFGYSPHDVSPQVDNFVMDPQGTIDRVRRAIIGKVSSGMQLAITPADEPSILCMVPGYDPSFAFMEEGIRAAFESNIGTPSVIVQYSFHFRQSPKVFLNLHANCALSEREVQLLKKLA